ncbi:hypothetical protein SLEP1_g29795 [Rubroshorea leprosula]|uniref:RING-type E3 ubiquitin transferase n=1 Tax=Rubroshorea leprosula TaxID=152421 RepID=A0AAV5JY42_9ROSI|nr:hypothetical protein SLEP1_g29795 [Rubroshorea leprosula]
MLSQSMADFTSPSSSSSASAPPPPLPPPCSFEKPETLSVGSSSSSGPPDNALEDVCSICLEPFTAQDPVTATSCRHEYHLQCILEWSQRSKECPICWQLFVLKDPASQELLTALESERNSKSRNISPHLTPSYNGDYNGEVPAYIDDSDFEERIMQHLASAAASRAHYFRRRERQRHSGFGPSDPFQDFVLTSPENMPIAQQRHATLPRDYQSVNYVSILPDSLTSGRASVNLEPSSLISPASVNLEPSSPISPSANLRPSPAVIGDEPTRDRKQETDSSQRSSSSQTFSFSESIKSKWSAASARYKESISKGTRGLKEKLLARNNSVRELSKEVQREMTAGIAGVTRMIERLDLASKKPGASIPVSSNAGGTSNFLSKGKGVEENSFPQNRSKNNAVFALSENSDAPINASPPIANHGEVSQTQGGH